MKNNSISISLKDDKGLVQGHCSDQFHSVLDTFVENFEKRDEVGASVVVTHEGETVVDLWGGRSSEATNEAWARDALSVVFSCTKGITGMIANILIERGLLDPCQPVADIWPEYATNGKEKTTVRMMLDHTAGVPVLRETVKDNGFYDWDYMCDLLASQQPYWEPGSKQGYHGVTYGWTIGELIRRVTGKSVGTNIQEILSKPLGLDLWCGLPEDIIPRVVPLIPAVQGEHDEDRDEVFRLAEEDPTSIPAQFIFNDGGWLSQQRFDTKESYMCEMPGTNGVSNARGLAGAYRPFALGGSVDGHKFVGADTLVGMEQISAATSRDQTLLVRTAFSLGFAKRVDDRRRSTDRCPLVLGSRAFGHVGAGGSVGFAEPAEGMSFGYNMNKMGATLSLTDRGQSLVDAVYQTLDYRSNAAGYWMR